MKATCGSVATLVAFALGLLAIHAPREPIQSADEPRGKLAVEHGSLSSSAMASVVEANGGKPPATGEQLWKTLSKLGKFAQLSVPFSAVHLESGLSNPRVIITPVIDGLSKADVTKPNFNGRLFLAANMERGSNGGDPRVTSVEFISWNTQLRRFDFGMIENMGSEGEPELRVVDGGRCFSCHKNRGPILGPAPWTNTTHHTGLRTLVAGKLRLDEVVPPLANMGNARSRLDGMALASPEAAAVDSAIRLGTILQLNRQTFQLMNQSPGGRKGFVAMLIAMTESEPLDPNNRLAKQAVEVWGHDRSYAQFASDWVALTKATNSGILIDFAPIPRPLYQSWGPDIIKPIPSPPSGGFPTRAAAEVFERSVSGIRTNNELAAKRIAAKMQQLAHYDDARSAGQHGMTKAGQPSNPKAFIQPPARATQKPSGMVNPVMLASTMGLTDGDREFLTRTLNRAVERVSKPKVTATVLARAVFEGPEFADLLAGGPLPDRDEFKDRFVAGLQSVLTTQYPFTGGYPIERKEFASGPVYDPKVGEKTELEVAPTNACLRCHDVRANGKRTQFDPIPPLVFDPFDKQGREAWLRTATEKRKVEVLGRLVERLHEDKDMPPEDSPEHERFRVKETAAFDELKDFLTSELAKTKGK